MTLGLLPYPATSMNAHVAGFAQEDLAPRGHRMDNGSNADVLLDAAYRQLFFHTMAADREPFLESQFRNGQINVQQLMRGLCLSERFQRWVYQCNSNYDVAAQLVQRLLGREVNGEQEKIAWSIVLGQEGLAGLVDALLNSPEYVNTFGVDTVPYQRRAAVVRTPYGQRALQYQPAPLRRLLAGCGRAEEGVCRGKGLCRLGQWRAPCGQKVGSCSVHCGELRVGAGVSHCGGGHWFNRRPLIHPSATGTPQRKAGAGSHNLHTETLWSTNAAPT